MAAVAALGLSSFWSVNASAQTPAPTPTPAPGDPAAPPADPNAVPPPAEPAPAPPPVETPPPAPPPPAAPPVIETPKAAAAPTFPSMGGPFLRLSEVFSFRPGLLLQVWGNYAQDPIPKLNGDAGDFSWNIYLRRARFYVAGQIGTKVSYLLLWESANLGQGINNADGSTNKQFTVFNFQDALIDFRINPAVSLQAGLMLVPFTRNILQSTATYVPLDIAGVSATYIGATQTNVLRDAGIQLKVNAAQNKFEGRLLVSQGVRKPDEEGQPRSPGKNSPRVTAYLQYNIFEPEAGYVFNAQYFGKKKVAGIALGGDYQSLVSDNPYWATSATAFAVIPLNGADPKNGGDEVSAQFEFLHYHGGRRLRTNTPAGVTGTPLAQQPASLLKQNDLMGEIGYYNRKANVSVFGKFEARMFDEEQVGDLRIYGIGGKYFLAEAAANITLMYSMTQFPNAADAVPGMVNPATMRNSASALQAQLQLAF